MAGSKDGGLRAAKTNKEKYGDDFYKRIGSSGGSAPHSSRTGFAAMDKEKVKEAGRLGGTVSRRKPAQNETDELDIDAILRS